MNKLASAGEDAWHLDRHARLVVYETKDGNELITVYDCAAAQKPPSAQIRANLVRVDADHEMRHTPTGYLVDMRERSRMERQDDAHYVVRG